MYYKAVLENGKRLQSGSNKCKTQEICNEIVNNYANAIKFVPD